MKKYSFTLAEVEICGVRSEAEARGSEGNACENDSEAMQLARVKQISKQAFTLAEVLITLAIIGVVAAMSIPSVISNSQQQEFKTGLRKAVSVLNSAITMNMALDGETPYDNANLMGFLMKHMAVMHSTTAIPYWYIVKLPSGNIRRGATNAAFYTTDGMRFEFEDHCVECGGPKLHETGIRTCIPAAYGDDIGGCGGCGNFGLNNNPNNTTKPPCIILVDVNGDKKPSPTNVDCNTRDCEEQNVYKIPPADTKTVTDLFSVLITEDRAVPYGVVAQKAMYQAQK
ncbi:MAG: type II secretion system protein [bacterium]|nr:type II secretion system protein [bacterium]